MFKNALPLLSVAAAALAFVARPAAAAPTLCTEYRYASQLNEYFVRGDAQVSESTALKRGIRLAAWDAENQEEASRVAVATAVFFFQVPSATRAVTIEVAYQVDQAAKDTKVAGFLFVRDKAIEEQFAEQNKEKRAVEEPTFFGSTYFLPAREPRVTITLPAENHVVDGVLEVHLSAGAGQVFDAQYIQVTALGAEVAPRVEAVSAERYVQDPYQYTYYYYYGGPCYYPYGSYYDTFQITSFDPIFWNQWYLRRAGYYRYHNWTYCPDFYTPLPLIVIYRPIYIIRPHIYSYRDHWYRRCFGIDPDHVDRRDLDHLVRHRRDRLDPVLARERENLARETTDKGREAIRELREHWGNRVNTRSPALLNDPGELNTDLVALRKKHDLEKLGERWQALESSRQHIPLTPSDQGTRGRTEGRLLDIKERPATIGQTGGTPKSIGTLPTFKPGKPLALPKDTPVILPPQDETSKNQILMNRFQRLMDGRGTKDIKSDKDNKGDKGRGRDVERSFVPTLPSTLPPANPSQPIPPPKGDDTHRGKPRSQAPSGFQFATSQPVVTQFASPKPAATLRRQNDPPAPKVFATPAPMPAPSTPPAAATSSRRWTQSDNAPAPRKFTSSVPAPAIRFQEPPAPVAPSAPPAPKSQGGSKFTAPFVQGTPSTYSAPPASSRQWNGPRWDGGGSNSWRSNGGGGGRGRGR